MDKAGYGAATQEFDLEVGSMTCASCVRPEYGCCEGYAAYLRQESFDFEIRPTETLDQMSRLASVPDELEGCHLVQIGG